LVGEKIGTVPGKKEKKRVFSSISTCEAKGKKQYAYLLKGGGEKGSARLQEFHQEKRLDQREARRYAEGVSCNAEKGPNNPRRGRAFFCWRELHLRAQEGRFAVEGEVLNDWGKRSSLPLGEGVG